MIFKILSEKENKLINRKEIIAKIEFTDKTPSNVDVKKKIAEHFKVDEKLIVINHIFQDFGIKEGKVYADIYNSEESFKKFVKIKVKKAKEEVKPEEKK